MDRHSWDERYAASDRTFTSEPNRLVREEVEPLAPGLALDVATGEGRHARWLAGLGWRVIAVDFSLVGMGKARAVSAASAGRQVAWLVADVHDMRLPRATFDLVLMSFFHPRPAERAVLHGRVARTLVPGGHLVQVSYDRANLTEGTSGPQDPEVLIDVPDIAASLVGFGFTVHRADTVRLRTPTANGEVDVVDVVDAIIHVQLVEVSGAASATPGAAAAV